MNQRVMLTKRLIKEATLKLLETSDISHVSIKQICLESGINRSTFYAHYNNAGDVLVEIERDIANELNQLIHDNRLSDIRARLQQVCVYFDEHRKVEKILMENIGDKELKMAPEDGMFHDMITSCYEQIFTSRDPVYLELAYTYIFHGMYHILSKWIVDNIRKTPEEIAQIMYDMIPIK